MELFETEHICSAASKKNNYSTIVNVDAKSTKAIPYMIIPLRQGDHQIEVKAASEMFYDGVKKILKVEVSIRRFFEFSLQY